jgi:hypothetical protein
MGSAATTRATRVAQGMCSMCLVRKRTPGLSSRGKPYSTCKRCRKQLAESDQRRKEKRRSVKPRPAKPAQRPVVKRIPDARAKLEVPAAPHRPVVAPPHRPVVAPPPEPALPPTPPRAVEPLRVIGVRRSPLAIAHDIMSQARTHDSAMPSDEDLDRLARAFVDMAKGPPDSRRLYVSFSAAQQFGKKRGIRDPEGARRQLTALLLHARPTSSPAVWRVRRDGQDVTARIARDEEGGTDLLVVVAANVRDL